MAKNRIAEARQRVGKTQREVAEELGITQQAYQYYEYGSRDIKGTMIKKMCKVFGVSASYLLGMTDDPYKTATSYAFVSVPLYGSIAAGTPIDMLEIDETLDVPQEVMDKHPGSFLLRVRGRSMDRVLPDGCYALVEPCDEILHDGKPYAVCVDGQAATIKRVRRLAHGYELDPDSSDPTYRPMVLDYNVEGTDVVTVIGEVVWYCIPVDWSF